jgi:hypothetical protein
MSSKKKKPKGSASKPKPIKGPEPERLKIDGDWVDAIDHALKVKRPATGWPK